MTVAGGQTSERRDSVPIAAVDWSTQRDKKAENNPDTNDLPQHTNPKPQTN